MSFYPLPRTMPIRERARIMVERGECKDFSEACSKLSRRKVKKPQPVKARLPYRDD